MWGRGGLPIPWPFWSSAEQKFWHCRTGHAKIHTTTTQNKHTEPQRIHGNTSTKLDRTISPYLQHAQGPNTSVQPKSPVWLYHMTALSRYVPPADWSQNLQIAPQPQTSDGIHRSNRPMSIGLAETLDPLVWISRTPGPTALRFKKNPGPFIVGLAASPGARV